MHGKPEDGRHKDSLENQELKRVHGGDGEGRRRLVAVVPLVNPLVHEARMKNAMHIVCHGVCIEEEGNGAHRQVPRPFATPSVQHQTRDGEADAP